MPKNIKIDAGGIRHSSPLDANATVVSEHGSMPVREQAEVKVSGWRVLAALAIGLAAGAGIGTLTYYAAHRLAPAVNSTILTQVIVFEVYGLLTLAVIAAFRPVRQAPLGLRFTSLRDLALALFAWLAVIAISAMVYVALKPAFGSVSDSLRKILTLATDAGHLRGQPMTAWAIAIPRGFLLAPLFEELFVRGAVLQWLRQHLASPVAIVVAAALFAAMHPYFMVMPFAFVFGVFTGWIRVRTGSTLNTVCMHAFNNLFFLCLGLLLLR